MSGIVRPRGRAPAGIYWRRRLVLLAVLLLATAGAVKLVGGGGEEPDASASSSPQPPEQDDGGPAADADPNRKARPDRDHQRVRSGERDVAVRMGPAAACDPADVTVVPSVRPDTYAGGDVVLRLGVSTDGDKPCVLSLADHTPLLSVSAGGGTVWSSKRCDDLVDPDDVRLEPSWVTYVDARWSGRTSGRTCGENADFAEPGEYTVQAALLGGEPSEATIGLTERPEPKDEDSDQQGSGEDSGDDHSGEGSGEQDPGDNDAGGDDSGDTQSGDDRTGDDTQSGETGDGSGEDETPTRNE